MPQRRHILRLLGAAAIGGALPASGPLPAVASQRRRPRLAVASNFRPAMEPLLGRFAASYGWRPDVVYGATGRLHAQIVNGAPFDALLAADDHRPRLLVARGLAVRESLFTYALGRLVLYARDPRMIDPDGDVLRRTDIPRLAIANPRHAPYGRAAVETLRNLGLLDAWRPRLVIGENVAQAFHYVRSGAAPLGFVALSHVLAAGADGSRWSVPARMHAPIRQQGVRLFGAVTATRRFLRFLKGPAARAIIGEAGYNLPPPA